LIGFFGEPLGYVTLSYKDLKDSQSTGKAMPYTLNYTTMQKLANAGPLGEASGSEAAIVDGRVVSVTWTYNRGERRHYSTGERSTKIKASHIESILGEQSVKKTEPGSTIYQRTENGYKMQVFCLHDSDSKGCIEISACLSADGCWKLD
jgi:hypothetical protein